MDILAFMKQHQDYFEDFITRSTYHSNAIEGSTLSMAETYAVLWNDDSMVIKATSRELYDAINYKYALSLALEDRSLELRESLVKSVGKQVNANLSDISGYRTTRVMIRGAEHMPPSPQAVVQLMMELVYAYNLDVRSGRDPFDREAEFHIRFERIHPFEDGNGRTGRILLNRGLIASGLPPAVITKEVRAEYMELIANQDVPGMTRMLAALSASEQARIEAFAG